MPPRRVRAAIRRAAPRIRYWTTGVLEYGEYEGSSERSFIVKLRNVCSVDLDHIAAALADEFHQLAALVLDMNKGECRIVPGALGRREGGS